MPRDHSRLNKDLLARNAMLQIEALLDTVTDGILIADGQGKITAWNTNFLTIWGITPEHVALKDLQTFFERRAQELEDPKGYLRRIAEIEAFQGKTFDLLHLANKRFVEQHSKAIIVNQKVIGRVWCFRTVAERHRSDQLSSYIAAIVDNSDDAIIAKDLNSIITSWNRGAERIFGYTAEEMIGTSIRRLIPQDLQDEEERILSRLKRGERYDHFETVRVTKDGRKLKVSLTISPIKDANGNIVGASKIARDISEREASEKALLHATKLAEAATSEKEHLLLREREAREEAEKANRMKDEFLATLSHELRTPLNAVLGWATVLRSGKGRPEEMAPGLEAIERNARVQAQIIDDLLDMSRIISGKVRLDVQPLDLAAVLSQAIETTRATASAKGVRLQPIVGSGRATISGDPNRLQQVFWNLLNNAIKFTPKGGRVQVILQCIESHIEVRIVDTGEGIAPESLPYIFNRFQQADASTTRRHGGLGLGLAIVKQLVELHGGTARAQSDGPGKGATFTVSFPLAPLHAFPSPQETRPSRSKPRELPFVPEVSLVGLRVLVVDDELDSRNLIKSVLETAEATVYLAESANEGMRVFLGKTVDLLICDIGMPDIDGYSLIRSIRMLSDAQKSEIPAVALTAYARSEDRREAIRAGFQNHLAKPVEPAELLELVQSLATRRSQRPAS